ncbi:tRNA (adenosine(37)-N6)-threonylcarbamoyltransferase complex transferase subunit TsaD [candidate division WWE3 bacterium RIFCSPLOWO2_01_FULL_39_13]|uniref:tRNA N6-adenosine threonylcarbamoyltransferase n=1 Tax=candidate division WWE3 bacterium RIFCSPLOWO2_01_FULL_39_13 TaxID=1802624 RepID=A0A1F4V5I1_UNCKA|nr:MAG: tRNA (adenosine(37)-N6)-threonylcarbamoyltransferase complex transferase subunit TsaD [candidate division WWE3 bacterium RIFCSPLOWO2_01_FULL_39_13]
MKILAIDTSCDDTSVAVSENLSIKSNVFWSKIKEYAKWQGVMPLEAKRQHEEFLPAATEECFNTAKLSCSDVDAVAVTQGPGLAIALEAGISCAKNISQKYKIPLIAVNHMAGHIYSCLARDENNKPFSGIEDFEFPLIALTVSGGHTDLYLMTDHLKFSHIGETIDDAVGESFDKVGRMLGMEYPAGPKIELSAKLGDKMRYKFPRPLMDQDNFNFSFSGLKTAVLYQILSILGKYKSKPGKKAFKVDDLSQNLSTDTINDLAASFQQAAIDCLVERSEKAVKKYKPKMFIVGGGVIANSALREQVENMAERNRIPLYYPKPLWLCTDNAAMIAAVAYFYAQKRDFVKSPQAIDRIPNLAI